MKRMLEHYTRKYGSDELDVPLDKVQINIQNSEPAKIPKKLEHRIGLQRNPLSTMGNFLQHIVNQIKLNNIYLFFYSSKEKNSGSFQWWE